MVNDPFQILQHPERTEWRTRVGATENVSVQPGPGRSIGYKNNRQSLHPWIVQLQRRRYRCADPTLRQSDSVLLRTAAVLIQGTTSVWSQRRQVPAGIRGAAMVYQWMLPCHGRCFDHQACCCGCWKAPCGSKLLVAGNFYANLACPY